MVLVASMVVAGSLAGDGSTATNTKRVWRLVIFGGGSPDIVGGNIFRRNPVPPARN